MSAPNVAEFILERLREWGVTRIYGYPGDGINGILGAFHEVGDKIEFIQARHEEMAAFMACAHAKFTGEVGVCMATSGPGAIHLLNGLYDAKLDHQPVVAIVGQQKRDVARRATTSRRSTCSALFKDVAQRVRAGRACIPAQARHAGRPRDAHRAWRRARVTCDHRPQRRAGGGRTSARRASTAPCSPAPAITQPRVVPARRGPATAPPRCSTRARRSRCSSAQGALDAARRGRSQVAELLGAGVAKALLGTAVLPDDLPFVTGSIGLLGTKPSRRDDGGLRHAADGRHELPLLGVAARAGPGARRADRHRRPRCSACATRWRCTLRGRRARRRCAR